MEIQVQPREQEQGLSFFIEQDQGLSSSIQPREQEQGLSSSIEQDQGLNSSIAFQAYVFFLTTLGALIQVKFQGSSNSLFEKHNAIISSFVVVISIYAGSVILGKEFGMQTIGPIRLLSGTFAPVLLMLILVPKFGWLLLILWVFLAAKIVRQQPYRHLYCQARGQVSDLFAKFRGQVSDLFAKFMTHSTSVEEDSPV